MEHQKKEKLRMKRKTNYTEKRENKQTTTTVTKLNTKNNTHSECNA